MLVIARKIGQKFWIDDNIQVKVTDVDFRNGQFQVKIGVTAPIEVTIVRDEIKDKYKGFKRK